jgi:hypothetical protein
MKLISIAISAGVLALCVADDALDLYQSFPKTVNGHALRTYLTTASISR